MSDDRKKAFWFIALLSVLVILPFLGETIFYSKGEPREAIVAFSMLESGNWILPVNYGTNIAYNLLSFIGQLLLCHRFWGECRNIRPVCRLLLHFWLCSWCFFLL